MKKSICKLFDHFLSLFLVNSLILVLKYRLHYSAISFSPSTIMFHLRKLFHLKTTLRAMEKLFSSMIAYNYVKAINFGRENILSSKKKVVLSFFAERGKISETFSEGGKV